MPAPFEVLAGPVEVYVAPLATAFPLVSAAPSATWIKLGASGSINTEESGVTLHDAAATTEFRGLGSTMPVKAFVTSEDLRVEFNLADIELEVWENARGGPATAAGNVVTTAAGSGTPGTKALSLVRGAAGLSTVALLLRIGLSPYGDFNSQYEFPKANCPGDGIALVYTKGVPVAVHFNWHIMYDANIRAMFQTAAPLP